MSNSELRRIHAFLADFARRQAAECVEVAGGFAVFDGEFGQSWANNRLVVDASVDPFALPALAREVLARLPYQVVEVHDEVVGNVCAGPLGKAGYRHEVVLVMLHTGPAQKAGPAQEVQLADIREPLTLRWRDLLPGAGEEVVRQLVERREVRRRGADIVRFIGSRAKDGELASWADLYADPASGTAQVEDLITARAHLGRGHAGAVLDFAMHRAAAAGCGTRFLLADAEDWPRHWYERRGFTAIGRIHSFERG